MEGGVENVEELEVADKRVAELFCCCEIGSVSCASPLQLSNFGHVNATDNHEQ